MIDVYERLRATVAAWCAEHGYRATEDPFSFDLQPHNEARAFYVDPPRLRIEGYIGAGASVTGQFSIWLSREAGTDAAVEAGRLAVALGALAVEAGRADLGDDVNVHESYTVDVQPRADAAVVVVGRLALSADWDDTRAAGATH